MPANLLSPQKWLGMGSSLEGAKVCSPGMSCFCSGGTDGPVLSCLPNKRFRKFISMGVKWFFNQPWMHVFESAGNKSFMAMPGAYRSNRRKDGVWIVLSLDILSVRIADKHL